MTDCLFCKIIAGEIQADVVYETEHLLAFRDINPQAPIHVLLIPKQHIATLDQLDDRALAGELLIGAQQVAEQEGLCAEGYRTVINCNTHGGQEVYHLHLHILGGRQLSWPPG